MSFQLHRVPRIHNPSYRRSGLKSYGHALRKHRIIPTTEGPFTAVNHGEQEEQFKGNSQLEGRTGVQSYVLQIIDASGTVRDVLAEDVQQDLEYICEVGIGHPVQTLKLDFDTGSSDFWVWSTEMRPSPVNSAEHTIFDPAVSNTFKIMEGSTWKIAYGDGSCSSGIVGTDDVKFGGLVIQSQAVELAVNVSEQLLSGEGDGVCGLAWDSINTVKPDPVQTPPTNMVLQRDITAAVFTAHLASWRQADDPTESTGFYTFGYIDETVLTACGVTDPSQIWYTDISNARGFWEFKSTAASVNGRTLHRALNNTAIADTGTPLALVSDEVCQAIYSAIPGAKYERDQQAFVFPSSVTTSELPILEFDVGGKLFALMQEDLMYHDLGNGYVYGGIQSRGNLNFDILGGTFLKGIYAIFDSGNNRFGAVQRTVG